jgi:ketosteroid isomerase-like protein
VNDSPKASSASEQEIVEAEKEWADVVMRKDKHAADMILADEFTLTGPELQRISTGRAATKDVWMETLPLIEVRSFDLNDMQITVYGSAAVAFVSAMLDWSIQGRPLPSRYMLTDLWVKREGRWKVVTRVSEPLD